MTWYRGHYGNWADGNYTRIEGSYSFSDIIARARAIAADKNITVTVEGERGTCRGIYSRFYEVTADGWKEV